MKKLLFNAVYGAISFAITGIFFNGIYATFPSLEKTPMEFTVVCAMAFFGALLFITMTWLIRRDEKKRTFRAF